nr:reverse transcriptase domain-containing protein [Tanacetum cinerariifolium]
MDLKTQLETVAKNHQASIRNLETKFDRIADKQFGRPFGSLPSNTQPNPKGHNSKAYQPSQARNEHVNAVFTRSDDEPTPQPKTKDPKPATETPLPKPYKPKIPYPQCLRKEKMEAQYGKFLNMTRSLRINVPLVDILAGMPNYGKFLKELISNKHKIEQIYAAFLSDESSAMIQNKVPPKLRDPRSFSIPCIFNKTFPCNALADIGASINLMPYSLYAKLSFKTLKPTKMCIRLADRSFQYPVEIAENMLVEVGKFTFPADFVILEMEKDSKAPLILGRPLLHTADAVIRVKHKQLNLGVGTERMIFNIDFSMKHSYSNDDTCFSINVTDEILEEDFDALLDILGICPSFCKHKIQLLDNKKPVVQKQRRLNPNIQEVVKKEIAKLLDNGIIYPIAARPWASLIHCVPKKCGITVVTNENDKLVPTRTVTVWREPMAWQTDYGIMKEGMSILKGRKSVLGISSNEREKWKERHYSVFTSSGNGRDQRNRGQQSNRSVNTGFQQSRGPSEGYSYLVCITYGRRHPGECRRAAVPASSVAKLAICRRIARRTPLRVHLVRLIRSQVHRVAFSPSLKIMLLRPQKYLPPGNVSRQSACEWTKLITCTISNRELNCDSSAPLLTLLRSLTVCLRMKGSTELKPGSLSLLQTFPKRDAKRGSLSDMIVDGVPCNRTISY